MESHVSKCMQIETSACKTHGKSCVKMHANGESCINGRCVLRRREKHKRKGEGEKKKEKKIKEREREKKGREEGVKEISVFFLILSAFQWSKLVGPRSKVCIFDEGYAPRGRDSSYFGLFLSFDLLFWVDFGTMLCHVYGKGHVCSQFKGCFWDGFGLKHYVYRRCQNSPCTL